MASSGGRSKLNSEPGSGAGLGSGQGAGSGSEVDAISQELSSILFAGVAKRLSETARRIGLDVPGFRSPPRAPGVRRSIRREADGSATVSVALRGRPAMAVVGDMIDGMITAGQLVGLEAGLARDDLWLAALVVFHRAEVSGEGLLAARSAA